MDQRQLTQMVDRAVMSIEQTSAPTSDQPRWALVVKMMNEYFTALRGLWGDIDGRSEQKSWEAVRDRIGAGETDVRSLRRDLDLCPIGRGHWTMCCDAACDCSCCGEDGCTEEVGHRHEGFDTIVGAPELTPPSVCPVHGRTGEEGA